MGNTVTLLALRILLISRARFWYFSSWVVRIFWSAGTSMSIIVHSCVSLCTTVISGRLCFIRLWYPKLFSLPYSLQLVRIDGHITYRYRSNPYFLHSSQWTCRATLLWRILYTFWASFFHPLTICHTVSVDSAHNLHSGVSDVLSILCLTEYVLKACSWTARIKPSVSFFKQPFLSHLQDSYSVTSEVCWANSPCRAFSLQLLSFSSFLLLL